LEDYIFQLDELVNPYQVSLSTDLEKNSNFHVTKNTFIIVDVDELNDVLRISGHTKVNEDDDSNEINIKDCNGDDDDEIKEKEDNSD
jgi:hypothetical protein